LSTLQRRRDHSRHRQGNALEAASGSADQADYLAEHPQNVSALAKTAQGKTTAGFERTWLFYFQIYLININ